MHFSKIAVAGLLPLALAAPVALEARYPPSYPPKMEPDYKTLAKILLLKHLENLYPAVGGGKGDTYPPAGGYPATEPAPVPVYPPAGGNSGATGGVPGGQPAVYPPPVYPPPVIPGGVPGATPPVYPDNGQSSQNSGGSGSTPGADLPIYPPGGVPGGGSPTYPDTNSNGGDYAGDDYDDTDYGYGAGAGADYDYDYGQSSGSQYDYRSLATEVAAVAKRQNQGSPAGNLIPIEVLRGGKINILNDVLNNSLNKLTAALGLGVLGAGTAAATPLNLG